MGEGEHERDDQEGFVRIPTGGLLMPQSGDDGQYTQTDAHGIQYSHAFTARNVVFQQAMLHTIHGINVQSNQHP